MYTSFHIKNFRLFEDLRLEPLARINLIAGKNNVGKTSILEAIAVHAGRYDMLLSRAKLLHQPKLSPDTFVANYGLPAMGFHLLFRRFATEHSITLAGDFYDKDAQHILHICILNSFAPIQGEKVQELNDLALRVQLNYSTDRFNDFSSDVEFLQLEANNQIEPFFIVRNKDLFAFSHQPKSYVTLNYLISDRYRDQNQNVKRFSELKREKRLEDLITALQIIEPRLRDLDLLTDGLYADIEGFDRLVPLAVMGDGMNQICSMVLAISDAADGVVLIDEIENGLHHSVQRDVWRALYRAAKQFNVQIFATTHSLEMIRAAHEAFQGDDQDIFRLHRIEHDQKTERIKAVTYDPESLRTSIELDFEVR